MKIAVYPGTFDPFTNGHLDILIRSSKLFDKVIVAVAIDSDKKTLFDIDERLDFIKDSLSGNNKYNNIEVEAFSGLLMHFVQKKKAQIIIRGLRAVSDFEYEVQMALMNHNLDEDVETLFLTTSSEYAFLSSTIIKSVVSLDGKISGLVSQKVEEALIKKFKV